MFIALGRIVLFRALTEKAQSCSYMTVNLGFFSTGWIKAREHLELLLGVFGKKACSWVPSVVTCEVWT